LYQKKLLSIYFSLSILVFLIFSLIISLDKGLKVLLGIIAIILPTIFLMKKAFSSSGASKSHRILGNFFVGETIKIIFSIILLTIFFLLCYNDANFILTGFMLGILIIGISPLLVKIKKR